MQTLANKNLKEERLPVLLGNATGIKLVGVAKYNTGSDLNQKKSLLNILVFFWSHGIANSLLSAYVLTQLMQILDKLQLLALQFNPN